MRSLARQPQEQQVGGDLRIDDPGLDLVGVFRTQARLDGDGRGLDIAQLLDQVVHRHHEAVLGDEKSRRVGVDETSKRGPGFGLTLGMKIDRGGLDQVVSRIGTGDCLDRGGR